MSDSGVTVVDAIGLECPLPLLQAKRALHAVQPGERVKILATDSGSARDFRVFAEQSGNLLLASEQVDGVYSFLLEKS